MAHWLLACHSPREHLFVEFVVPGQMMPVDRLCGSRSALADCVTISEMPAVVEASSSIKRAIPPLPLEQELEL
jgi:hypothetical protein